MCPRSCLRPSASRRTRAICARPTVGHVHRSNPIFVAPSPAHTNEETTPHADNERWALSAHDGPGRAAPRAPAAIAFLCVENGHAGAYALAERASSPLPDCAGTAIGVWRGGRLLLQNLRASRLPRCRTRPGTGLDRADRPRAPASAAERALPRQRRPLRAPRPRPAAPGRSAGAVGRVVGLHQRLCARFRRSQCVERSWCAGHALGT